MLATQSPAIINYKAVDNVNTIYIGKITSEQSLKKIETFLEPYGKEVQNLVRRVQTVKPGQFLLIGGGQTKPEIFQTRWLYTKRVFRLKCFNFRFIKEVYRVLEKQSALDEKTALIKNQIVAAPPIIVQRICMPLYVVQII